jgi:carboxyl-terminal processing protease
VRKTKSFLFAALFTSSVVLSCGSPQKTETPPPVASAVASVSASAAVAPPPVDTDNMPEVARDPREAFLSSAAIALLSKEHVLAKPIDDNVSKEAFPKFVEELDGTKMFLLDSDVKKLARYETQMDDELRSGDLTLARKGAALIAARRQVVAKLVADTLATPLDFTVQETFETDPKKREFCKTEEELAARWRSMLKLQVLERVQQLEDILDKRQHPKPDKKGAPKDPDEVKREQIAEKALGEIPATFEGRRDKVEKELATRYSTQFTRLGTTEKLEPAEEFINAVNAVFDPHTTYMAPSEEANFDIAITGRLEGIGATLQEQEHYIVVHDLVPGGAAWQQGKLEIGDLILSVAQEGKDPVDATDLPIDKVVSMIRGPKGTVVVLTVKKPDGSLATISITRDVIRIEATYARGAIVKKGPNGEQIGYVHLPGFYGDVGPRRKPGERNATDDVRAILNQLTKKGVTELVLDLRGNGGGLLTHARDISGLFITEGPVVQTKDSEGSLEVLRDTDKSVAFGGQVVVLVDRFSASAAEILAGALQDYERAVVVGTSATHGKGTVQSVIDLDRLQKGKGDPLGLYKITTAEYFRVSGGSTQLKGVVPDVLLPDPTSFVESGERTLFHAIPWTTIQPAPFVKVPHAWKTADLATASAARTQQSQELATVTKFSKIMEARKNKTTKSLERNSFQEENKRAKAELEAVDPKKQDRKPLLEVISLPGNEAAPAAGAAVDPRIQKRLDAWKDDLARDPWVDECTRILGDMKKATK